MFRQVDPGSSIPPDLAASVTLVIQLFLDSKDEKLPLRLGGALVTYKLTIRGRLLLGIHSWLQNLFLILMAQEGKCICGVCRWVCAEMGGCGGGRTARVGRGVP